MDRNIKDRVIVSEHIRSAITDMDIPIKNTNLLLVEFFLSNSGSYSHVIEKTKPSNIRAMSVMTRRPYNSKNRIYRLTRIRLTKSPYSFDCPTCR